MLAKSGAWSARAALGAAGAAANDYAWPVMRVIDGATLVVDAGADLPPELAALAGASKVVVRNPRFGGPDCECQVVADVVVDGAALGGR